MFQKMLQRIVEKTAPARLPKPWHFLSAVESVRQLLSEPRELVASLVDEFGESELVDAHVLLRASAGELRLTPVVDATAPFKVVKGQKDGTPCDFESQPGRVTAGDPAALRCHDDHRTRERSAKRKWVLATFSNADLAVLSLLGLPATTACGLSNITADQARRLITRPKKSLGVPQQTDASAQLPEERPRIVFVGIELSALRNQMPAGLLHAATQFRRIERAMGLDTASHVGIWLPSPADFQRIRDAVELADRQLVFDAIKNSVRSSESITEYFKSTSEPAVGDVPRARRKLRDALKDLPKSSFGTRDVEARFDDLNRAQECAMIERIQHEAMVAANPLDKPLWNACSELLEMQLEASQLVQRTTAAIATGRAENVDTSIEDRLRFQLRLAEGLIRIKKAIELNK